MTMTKQAVYQKASIEAQDILNNFPPLMEENGKKCAPSLHYRTFTFDQTIERLNPFMSLAGITRVADITELDKSCVPVFQCVRPLAMDDEDTFTVFSGKGLNKSQCEVSAIAEGIERYCAESQNYPSHKLIVTSYNKLKQQGHVIHPAQFHCPESSMFDSDEELEWVCATNLMNGESTYVTANVVFYPYQPTQGRALFRYFTTGLATGNNFHESIIHGLYEVIERDAAALNKILRQSPVVPNRSIDNPDAQRIIAELAENGVDVIVRYITQKDVPVPVFSVICEDTKAYDPLFVNGGYGANLNKDIALLTALNEAVASRLGAISGAREDLAKFEQKRELHYQQYKRKYSYWFDKDSRVIDYQDIPSEQYENCIEDMTHLITVLSEAGFKDILLVDLNQAGFPQPVVKMLVPGVERYSFKMECIGQRAKDNYYQIYDKPLIS
ncbi:YcaO-like family protein [Vibrio ostreicida]